jgi:hypothetical protein
VGLAALGGAALVLYPRQGPHPLRAASGDCGLVRCSANVPAATSASPSADGTPGADGKSRAAATRVTASAPATTTRQALTGSRPPAPAAAAPAVTAPAPALHPSPSPPVPPPPPSPPPGRPVTVTYTVDQTANGWHGPRFMAHFTLVNHTGSAVSDWTLQAGLPHGRVWWVSRPGRGWPGYPDWSPTPDGVVIAGRRPGESIPAHASVVLYLYGSGAISSPPGCAFDGTPC